MPTKATLGGYTLLNTESISWKFTKGTQPYQNVFELHPEDADALFATKAESVLAFDDPGISFSSSESGSKAVPQNTFQYVELRIEVEGRKPLIVKDLILLQVVPASQPYLKAVLVSDKRWLWSRKLVTKDYNIRRRSGNKRISGTGGSLQLDFVKQGPIDEVKYASFSLKNGTTVWSAEEILKDVLNVVTDGNFDTSKCDFSATQPVIEGIILNGPGDSQLGIVLNYCGSVEVFMDENGVCQATTQFDGSETEEVGKAYPPVVGPPPIEVVTLDRVRPSAIDVFFQPEDELRFNFFEPVTANTQDRDNPPRILENVIQVTDPSILIDGKYYTYGSWVPINDALMTAWNTQIPAKAVYSGGEHDIVPVSLQLMRDQWCSEYSIWDEAGKILQENPIWKMRIESFRRHYRQTFRIPYTWMSRLRSFRLDRVAIADEPTLTRAKSDVYAQYSFKHTMRRIAQLKGDPGNLIFQNIDGYADDLLTELNAQGLPKARPAPAKVEVLDDELGIFHIEYQGDCWGGTSMVLPSRVGPRSDLAAEFSIPTWDVRAQDGLTAAGAALTSTHKLAIVLTVATASPNNLGRLYKYRVTANDVRSILPTKSLQTLGKCSGPVWQVFVGPDVTTAKFAWLDPLADKIVGSILRGEERQDALLVYPEEIQAVARAVAATIYLGMCDHFEGSRVTEINPALKPYGRAASVSHELMRDGKAFTTIDLPPDIKPIDMFALMPDTIRRRLLRQVQ